MHSSLKGNILWYRQHNTSFYLHMLSTCFFYKNQVMNLWEWHISSCVQGKQHDLMDCPKHQRDYRFYLFNSVVIHCFSCCPLLEQEWGGDPTKLNSIRSVNELASTSSVGGEYGRILESTSSWLELNGKKSIEDTLRSNNMGRHVIVAATSTMTKRNALIMDDEAMSNALSTGEGEEESFLLSSLVFSLLSSNASLLNLCLKRGSTN